MTYRRNPHELLSRRAQALNKGLEPDLSDRLMSVTGHRTLFSSDTDSAHWRLVRKGVAPAFSASNIRCALAA